MTESIVVTGALGETGAAVAARLARSAVRLCLSDDRRDATGGPRLDERQARLDLTERLVALGGEVAWIEGTSGDPETADRLMRAALDGEATLTGVVHCEAGRAAGGRVSEVSIDSWRAAADTDLAGSFFIARAFGRAVRLGHRATLVLVTSRAGLHPAAGIGPRGAASAGVAILAQSVALEIGKYGGRAYAVLQGATSRGSVDMAGAGGIEPVPASGSKDADLSPDIDPHAAAAAIEVLLSTPDQLACIIDLAGNQIASYRRTPRLTFVLAEESTPEEVLGVLNGYAHQAGRP